MSTGRKRLLAYVIMVVSLTVSIKLVKDIVRLWQVDDLLIKAEDELAAVKEEQLRLKEEIEKIESGYLFEKQVRNVLKMARPNEEVVVVPDEVTQRARGLKLKEELKEREEAKWQKWARVFGIIN